MELLPYEQFSAFRLEQFLPPDAEIVNGECDRQVWRCQCHSFFARATIFCFGDIPPATLSGIDTELGEGALPTWALAAPAAVVAVVAPPPPPQLIVVRILRARSPRRAFG